jgi:hypothetical protein
MTRRTLTIGAAAAAIASLAALPLVLTLHRPRARDYTSTPEFQSLVSGYIM